MTTTQNPTKGGIGKPRARRNSTKTAAIAQVPKPSKSKQGTVTLLKSGNYQARVTKDSGKRESIGTYASEAAANAAIDHFYQNRRVRPTNSRALVVRSTRTMLQVFDDWCQDMDASPTRSKNSARRRRNFREGYLLATAKRAVAAGRVPLGSFHVDDLDFETCRRWARAQFMDEGLKPVTVVNNWAMLRRTFEHARRQHWIEANPLAGEFPMDWGTLAASESTPFLLTLPEMVRLTQTFSPRHALFAEVLIWSGMRQSEVRALRGNDLLDEGVVVDEALEALHASRPVFGRTKNRQSVRYVPLPPLLIDAMRRHAKHGEVGPVFTIEKARKKWADEHGNPVPRLIPESDVGSWFRAARAKAGIVPEAHHPVPGRRLDPAIPKHYPLPTAHDCRATVVSLLQELGATHGEVQAWVGHAPGSAVTDERYSTASALYRTDPVVLEVKQRASLNLAQKWALLYERAWEEYGPRLAAEFPE